MSTLAEGALLVERPRPKKLVPSWSNFEGDGGDSPGLKTGSDSKLVERSPSVPGKVAVKLLLCTRFVRLPILGVRLRRPKKPPSETSLDGPARFSLLRSLMFPKLELLYNLIPDPLPLKSSKLLEPDAVSCKSPLLARRRRVGKFN